MIFVTVGVQLPFDRLVKAVDQWAEQQNRRDVVAQTGDSSYIPRRLEARARIPAGDFRALVEQAELIVAHAGMGSIITALELGKNIIVMPRRADLGEHRNDHQLATARYMELQGIVKVASNEHVLADMLSNLTPTMPQARIGATARPELISAIRDFIAGSCKC